MSENVGLHTQLTADSGNFVSSMAQARNVLAQFAAEQRKLRSEIAEAEKNLKEQSAKFGKNSNEAKKAEAALQELYSQNLQLKDSVKSVTDSINKQTSSFAKNAKQGNNTAEQLKSGFNMLKGLALGYAGKTLYEALIGSNAQYEQYMTSFEVLLGSADKADKMMENLSDFAAETPLELMDATKAAQLLMSYGVAQDEVITRMQQLGDLSLGNAEKLDRVSLAYGQMLAKGKVTGEELRQMTEAGVPMLQALADVIGVSTGELSKLIEKGEVGMPELNKAIESMTSYGGKFYGMMEKQSQTWTGMLSTIKDNVNMFSREVGEGTFDALKTELDGMLETINQMKEDGSLEDLASEIGGDIAAVVTTIVDLVKWLWEMKNAIVAGAGAVAAYKVTFTTLTTAIGLFNSVKELFNIITGKTVVCLNTETGATIKLSAAKATEVIATNNAIVAQTKLNAVLNGNAIAAVISLVAALVGALVSYNAVAGDAADATESLTEKYKAAKEQIDETTNSEIAQAEKIRALKDRLYELDAQVQSGTLSDGEATVAKKEMNSIVDTLNENIPNLKLAIDDTTGALNLQETAVNNLTESYYKLKYAQAMIKAYDSKIDEAAKTIVESDEIIESTKLPSITFSAIGSESYTDALSQGYEQVVAEDATYTDAVNAKATAESDIKEFYSKIAGYNEQIDTLLDELGLNKESGGGSGGGSVGGTTGGNSEGEKNRKAKIDAYKKKNENFIKQDEDYNARQLEFGYINQNDYIYAIGQRAEKYQEWAKEVVNLDYMTYDEKRELITEYLEKADKLEREYLKQRKALKKDEFNYGIEQSKKWIEERNKRGDWALYNDNEIEATKRILAKTKEFYNSSEFYNPNQAEEYINLVGELEDKISDLVFESIKERNEAAKEAEEERLEMEYNNRKRALEKELEDVKDAAERRIKYLDNLQKQREEDKEDEEDNLKLERLETRLAYETDEGNKKSLMREINALNEEIADKEFDRYIEKEKEKAKKTEEIETERINNMIEFEAMRKEAMIDRMSEYYTDKMLLASMAVDAYNEYGIDNLIELMKTQNMLSIKGITVSINDLLSVLQPAISNIGGYSALGSTTIINNTTNSNNNTTFSNTFTGEAPTASEIARSESQTIDKLRLRSML